MIMTGCIRDILNEVGCELMWRQAMTKQKLIQLIQLIQYVHIKWAAIPIIELVRDIDPKNIPVKVKARLKKNHFPSYRADKLGVRKGRHTDRKQTDKGMNRQTGIQTQAMTIIPDLKVVG